MLMPSDEWTPPLPDRQLRLGRRGNQLAWSAFLAASWIGAYDRQFNRYRRSIGSEPIRGAALMSQSEADRVVVLGSRHYFGEPPADRTDTDMVGFSPWPGPTNQSASPDVLDYIEDGDPPVLVCLGTAVAHGAHDVLLDVVHGLLDRGIRPLAVGANDAVLAQELPGVFGFVPLTSIAPRCRAAVVSGALGTLAAVLTAGMPAVVLPQLIDQLWHGRRVEELGVGRLAVRRSAIPSAVLNLLHDSTSLRNAHELGSKLAHENGSESFADAVESML